MKTAEIIVPLLKRQALVTDEETLEHSDDLVRIASEIKARKSITLDEQLELTLIGTVGEIGAKQLLNSSIVWSRFSQQQTRNDMTYDLGFIIRQCYENWEDETLLDVKLNNKSGRGDYYAFNCYNKETANAELQMNRGGANLNYFIYESPKTKFLLICDQMRVSGGWLVTPRYLIHRDAFKLEWRKSRYETSPFYYIRYNDMIRAGVCWQLN